MGNAEDPLKNCVRLFKVRAVSRRVPFSLPVVMDYENWVYPGQPG